MLLNLEMLVGRRNRVKMKLTEEEINFLTKEFGRGYKNIDFKLLKKYLLLNKLITGIKKVRVGDVIYKFNDYKNIVEDFKEYVVFGVGNNTSLLGDGDIIINRGGGYIAGGLDGRAVLKKDWIQYLKGAKSE